MELNLFVYICDKPAVSSDLPVAIELARQKRLEPPHVGATTGVVMMPVLPTEAQLLADCEQVIPAPEVEHEPDQIEQSNHG